MRNVRSRLCSCFWQHRKPGKLIVCMDWVSQFITWYFGKTKIESQSFNCRVHKFNVTQLWQFLWLAEGMNEKRSWVTWLPTRFSFWNACKTKGEFGITSRLLSLLSQLLAYVYWLMNYLISHDWFPLISHAKNVCQSLFTGRIQEPIWQVLSDWRTFIW